MNLLARFLPMWVLNTALLSAIIDARSEPAVSSISVPVFVTQRQPISQFSLKMQAESPGISTMQRIFCFYGLVCFVHYLLVWVNGFALAQKSKLKIKTPSEVDRFLV